jgi:hypothetical protein
VRTNYRLEDVYLYRLTPATPERARALFLDYLQTANQLHERAQWYNELTSNCTTNERARAADRDPDFSRRIRDGLPGM